MVHSCDLAKTNAPPSGDTLCTSQNERSASSGSGACAQAGDTRTCANKEPSARVAVGFVKTMSSRRSAVHSRVMRRRAAKR